jgi:hypothetical protein
VTAERGRTTRHLAAETEGGAGCDRCRQTVLYCPITDGAISRVSNR